MTRKRDSVVKMIRGQLPLLDEVRGTVDLQQRGRDWWGSCPFHADKTPSFKVNPERGSFYCFGCQAKGDVIDFVARRDHMTNGQAIHHLATVLGIEQPQPGRRPGPRPVMVPDVGENIPPNDAMWLREQYRVEFDRLSLQLQTAEQALALSAPRIAAKTDMGDVGIDLDWDTYAIRLAAVDDATWRLTELFCKPGLLCAEVFTERYVAATAEGRLAFVAHDALAHALRPRVFGGGGYDLRYTPGEVKRLIGDDRCEWLDAVRWESVRA